MRKFKPYYLRPKRTYGYPDHELLSHKKVYRITKEKRGYLYVDKDAAGEGRYYRISLFKTSFYHKLCNLIGL